MSIKPVIKTSIALVLGLILGLPISNALAAFPDKPITMLIGFNPGGAVDTTGRLLAEKLEKELGVPIVPVTASGGGGTVMAAKLINEKADGYTIGMGASAAYTLAPQIGSNATVQIDDLAHIATVSIPQDAIVVSKNSPWNSMEDMINDAKKNNKTLSFGSQVAVVNLMADVINSKTGVNFKIVPVKGGSVAIQQVLGGHVDLTWSASGWISPAPVPCSRRAKISMSKVGLMPPSTEPKTNTAIASM